jgi:hypothetical protein
MFGCGSMMEEILHRRLKKTAGNREEVEEKTNANNASVGVKVYVSISVVLHVDVGA